MQILAIILEYEDMKLHMHDTVMMQHEGCHFYLVLFFMFASDNSPLVIAWVLAYCLES